MHGGSQVENDHGERQHHLQASICMSVYISIHHHHHYHRHRHRHRHRHHHHQNLHNKHQHSASSERGLSPFQGIQAVPLMNF